MDEAFRSFPADDGSMIALSSGLNKVFRIGIMKMRLAGNRVSQIVHLLSSRTMHNFSVIGNTRNTPSDELEVGSKI